MADSLKEKKERKKDDDKVQARARERERERERWHVVSIEKPCSDSIQFNFPSLGIHKIHYS